MTHVWKAYETTFKIQAASATTITTVAALDSFWSGSGIEGQMKNVTIAEPEAPIEKLDLLGASTGGAHGNTFQNAQLDFKPYGLATISGTLLVDEDEALESFFLGTADAIGTTMSRYQAGQTDTTGRPSVGILVNLTATGIEVNFAMDNAYITKLGEYKISDAAGHWEVDFEAICLPVDFYVEYLD